eukprot:6202751-Pleurochrysis_carterae.AAC.1
MERRGCCKGELNIVLAIKDLFNRGKIPQQMQTSQRCTASSNIDDENRAQPVSLLSSGLFVRDPPLRHDQLKTLAWMKLVEDDIENGQNNIQYNQNIHIAGQWYFSMENESFVRSGQSTSEVRRRGGIVNGPSGMGKCAIVVAHIGDRRRYRQVEPKCLHSGNTLIIVPSHLLHHWSQEIQKFGSGMITSTCVTSMKDLKALTFEDVRNTDIILIASTFMRNKAYAEYVEGSVKQVVGHLSVHDKRIYRESCAISIYRRCLAVDNIVAKTVILEAVTWNRVVIDELGLTMENGAVKRSHLWAKYWWGISSTHITDASLLYFFLYGEETEKPNQHPCLTKMAEERLQCCNGLEELTYDTQTHNVAFKVGEVEELRRTNNHCICVKDINLNVQAAVTLCASTQPQKQHIQFGDTASILQFWHAHDGVVPDT